MNRGLVSPNLLLAAIAWGMATRGGTAGRDMTIIVVLLAAARLLPAGPATRERPHAAGASTVLFLLFEAWLIFVGLLRVGPQLTAVRVPILVLAAVLSVSTVRRFDLAQRAGFLHGTVILGTLHASIALAQSAAHVLSSDSVTAQSRAVGLLGNANALGIIVLATTCLTARELERERTPVTAYALALQAVAILVSGSRIAILLGLGVLSWHAIARGGWRTAIFASPWAILAMTILSLRFASTPPTRLYLWSAAVHLIARHPLLGQGPGARVIAISLPAVNPTTHAHNEVLQLVLEYGLIGLVLGVVTVVVGLRSMRKHWSHDRWVMAGAVVLAASGLTDFTLRITAITVLTSALIAAARVPFVVPALSALGHHPDDVRADRDESEDDHRLHPIRSTFESD
jgi:O-antigen ligase